MSNANTAPEILLPARVAFVDCADRSRGNYRTAIVGTPGTHGDAGWSVFRCRSLEHRAQIMRDYPAARVPCWSRLERQYREAQDAEQAAERAAERAAR